MHEFDSFDTAGGPSCRSLFARVDGLLAWMAWGTVGAARLLSFQSVCFHVLFFVDLFCFHFGAWEAFKKIRKSPLWGQMLPQGRSRLHFGSMFGSSSEPSGEPHVNSFRPWTCFRAPREV